MRRFAISGAAALVLACASVAHAQQLPRRGFCWISADSGCKTILITEVGYAQNLLRATRTVEGLQDSTYHWNEYSASRGYVLWQLGGVTRVSRQWAVGGALEIRSNTVTPDNGWVYLRSRYWVTPKTSLDLSLGKAGVRFPVELPGPVTLVAGINLHDRLVLRASYDDVPWRAALGYYAYPDNKTRARSLQLSGAAGSLAGGVALAASALGVLALSLAGVGQTD